jgi:hypothetical protein
MASLLHEAVVELLRNRPRLSLELLDRAVPLPLASRELLGTEGRVESVDLGDAKPLERAADFVAGFGASTTELRVITEVQLGPDPDKHRSWPGYVAVSWARTGVATHLLVLALDPEVAQWAARPIDVGHFVFRPIVVGPEAIPLLVDPRAARESPELAVLAVHAHRHSAEVLRIAAAALDAVNRLDEARARFYSELVLQWLPAAARAILEATMDIKTEFISDYTREKIAQARAEGRAEALLHVLGARGISVDDAAAQRIRSCTDIAVLDSWLERAVSVRTAEELFAWKNCSPDPTAELATGRGRSGSHISAHRVDRRCRSRADTGGHPR